MGLEWESPRPMSRGAGASTMPQQTSRTWSCTSAIRTIDGLQRIGRRARVADDPLESVHGEGRVVKRIREAREGG